MIRLRSDGLAVTFLFTGLGVLACLAPAQSDTWWLLRAGRDTWATHSIALSDAYSHTAAGRYWWHHEWLSEVLFYALFWLGRLPLIATAAAALILSTWGLSWRMARGAFEWKFVAVAAAAVASAGSWALRPQLLSMLCFSVVCWCLAGDRRKWWVPLLVVIWINLHGAAVVSVVLVAGAALATAVVRRRVPWSDAGLLALTALSTICSPIGFRTYREIAASVERSRINALIEWLPPNFALSVWPFWILAAAVLVTVILRRDKVDLRAARLLGIAVAVLPLAVRSTRNVHLFLLAAVPAVTSAWAPAVEAPVRSARGEREGVNGGLAVGVVLAAVAVVATLWTHPPPKLGWRPISPAAADAIRSCPSPLYNTYGDGGILIWFTPTQPVFIDNRQDPYPDDLLRLNRHVETTGQYEDAFARFGIRCAALAPNSLVAKRLEHDGAWAVTYRDAQWVVAQRTSSR